MVRNVSLTLAFALLASCGGGSGDGGGPVTVPTTPAPSPTPSATPTPSPTPTPAPSPTPAPVGGGYLAYSEITADRQFDANCVHVGGSAYRRRSVDYSPAGRSYVMRSIFFGEKFGPAYFIAKSTFPSSSIVSSTESSTSYLVKSGDVTDSLAVQKSDLNLVYLRRAEWSHIAVIDPKIDKNPSELKTYCVFGLQTKAGEIQKISSFGFARYSVQGVFSLADGSSSKNFDVVDSRVEFSVDGVTKIANLSLLLIGKSRDGVTMSVGPYRFSGLMDSEGVFNLGAASPETNVFPDAVGGFYGPSAAELGLVFKYNRYSPKISRNDFAFYGSVVGVR